MSREDADIFEQLYRSFQKKITLGNGVEGFLDYCKSNDIFIAHHQTIYVTPAQLPLHTVVLVCHL